MAWVKWTLFEVSQFNLNDESTWEHIYNEHWGLFNDSFLGPHIMSAPGSELGIIEQVKNMKIMLQRYNMF